MSQDAVDTQKELLASKLRKDILACDCQISLFWAALSSYRHDSVLRPFPPMFVSEESKNVDELRTVFKSLPALEKLSGNLNRKQTELLEWILNPRCFNLQYKSASFIDNITTEERSSNKPQYIFELSYNKEIEKKFRSVVGSHGVFYAFHGSSIENFYSIIHNGLLNMFNKVSAFGEGTYLSSELSVCLNWSPTGSLWPHSMLPQMASCVAVCEVVRHPSVMSKQAKCGGEPNLHNSVPKEYFVVSNDELVRVKYLLFYRRETRRYQGRGWLQDNKFTIVILVYGLVLLLVGALQSNLPRKLYKKYVGDL